MFLSNTTTWADCFTFVGAALFVSASVTLLLYLFSWFCSQSMRYCKQVITYIEFCQDKEKYKRKWDKTHTYHNELRAKYKELQEAKEKIKDHA